MSSEVIGNTDSENRVTSDVRERVTARLVLGCYVRCRAVHAETFGKFGRMFQNLCEFNEY